MNNNEEEEWAEQLVLGANGKCFFCNTNDGFISESGVNFCEQCFAEQKAKTIEMFMNKTTFHPEIDQINDKVFLGNEDGAREKETLKKYGINRILVCAEYSENFHPNDFEYKTLLLDDDPCENLKIWMKEALIFIDEADKVYVHCLMGISRSAAIVIAYFMWKDKLSFDDARRFVQMKRSCICPNSGFVSQLKEFEEFLVKNSYNLQQFQ